MFMFSLPPSCQVSVIRGMEVGGFVISYPIMFCIVFLGQFIVVSRVKKNAEVIIFVLIMRLTGFVGNSACIIYPGLYIDKARRAQCR